MADALAADDAARLTDFSRAFKAAARAVVLYPGEHPAITASLARLAQLTSPPRLLAPMRVRVTADALLIDGLAPAKPDAALRELAVLLHGHLIGELTVNPGGDVEDWRKFLLLLGRATDAVRAEGGIARLWTTMAGLHLELREIDYAEVLRERRSGAAASWAQVVASCLQGSALEVPEDLLNSIIDGTGAPSIIADALASFDGSAEHASSIPANAAALVQLLRAVISAVRTRAPQRLDDVLADLAAALGQVSPELLLGVIEQAGHDETRAATIGQVVSRMPDEAIANFLARNTVRDGAPIERVALAFQALVVDDARRERLVTMARDSAVAAGAGGAAFDQSWQVTAGKLLAQYSDEPFVSRSYARELTRAHVQAIELERVSDDPPERLAAWLGTVSTTEVRRLDLRLVLDLLRIEEDPERREPLLTPVVSLVDDLLLVGDFEAADQLLAALRADAEQADDTARAGFARRTLARLVADSTMQHLVSHLNTVEDAQMARVKMVCVSLGESLVRPLAEVLASEQRSRTRERLTEILIAFGAVGRREVEQLKNSANPAVRRTAIYLLREFGGSDALPELTELLDDAEPVVQREAVRAILKIGTDRGYRVLEQALVGGTRGAREAIMQALGSPREERAAPLLAYILEHVSHRGDLSWVYERALELLSQLREPRSIPALRAALYRGEWWTPTRTAQLRRHAAAALARIDTAEARAVLTDAAANGPRSARAAARAELDAAARQRKPGGGA